MNITVIKVMSKVVIVSVAHSVFPRLSHTCYEMFGRFLVFLDLVNKFVNHNIQKIHLIIFNLKLSKTKHM